MFEAGSNGSGFCCSLLSSVAFSASAPEPAHQIYTRASDSHSRFFFAPFLSRCAQGAGGFGPPPPSRGTVPGDGHCRGTAAVTGLLLLLLSPSRRGVPSRHQALAGHDGAPRLRRGTAHPRPRRGRVRLAPASPPAAVPCSRVEKLVGDSSGGCVDNEVVLNLRPLGTNNHLLGGQATGCRNESKC